MYELFDHTADICLRVVADDLDGLFRDAADGFFSLIVEEIPDREPVERLHFEVSRQIGARLYEETLQLIDFIRRSLDARCTNVAQINLPLS